MSTQNLLTTLSRRGALALSALALAASAGCASAAADNSDAVRDDGSVDLSKVTLTVGDQKGGSKALLQASGAIDELPYKVKWKEFTSGPPLLEALNAGAIDVGGVGIQRVFHLVIVHGRPDADARMDTASGQNVDRREILGQPQGVLPPQRDDGRPQLDPAGALRRRREDRDGRGDPVLQVAMAQPRTVEAQPLAQFDDLQGRLVAPARVRLIEQPDRQEAQLPQRFRSQRHKTPPSSTAYPAVTFSQSPDVQEGLDALEPAQLHQ
jgi:hypothetical protein